MVFDRHEHMIHYDIPGPAGTGYLEAGHKGAKTSIGVDRPTTNPRDVAAVSSVRDWSSAILGWRVIILMAHQGISLKHSTAADVARADHLGSAIDWRAQRWQPLQ